MKAFLLSLFLCLFSSSHYAQKDKIIYLDSLGVETDFENHITLIKIEDFKKDKNLYNAKGYYKSGKLKFEVTYSNKWLKTKEGDYISYYESGNIQSKVKYFQNVEGGEFYEFYENGNRKTEGEYITEAIDNKSTNKLIINNFWDKDGNQQITNGNGFYTETDNDSSSSGEIKRGLKHGKWTGISTSLKLSFEEEYKNGKLINGVSVDNNGNQYTYKEIYQFADPKNGMPEFRKKIANYIMRNLPDVKSTETIKAIFSFTIDENGNLKNIQTLKSFKKNIDSIFINAISMQSNWNAAKHRGKNIKSQFSFPMTIQIQ